MPIINPTLPNDGENADAADVSNPITQILSVLNGGIDSDNIAVGGLTWAVMSNFSNSIPAAAMQDDGNLRKYRDELNVSLVASGLTWSTLTGLAASMAVGVLYTPNGSRVSLSAIATRTFTASKDTYVYADVSGSIGYSEVTNGADAPVIGTDITLIAKVITNGSAITSIIDIARRSGDGWVPYTPLWTAASSNPSLGNGSLNGYYSVGSNKTVRVKTALIYGSTTTNGSGVFYFSLPTPAKISTTIPILTPIGNAAINDAGTQLYTGRIYLQDSSKIVIRQDHITGSNTENKFSVAGNDPITLANGDGIFTTFEYEAL